MKNTLLLLALLISTISSGQDRFDTVINVTEGYSSRILRVTSITDRVLWVVNDSVGRYKYDGLSELPVSDNRTPYVIAMDTLTAIMQRYGLKVKNQ